MPCQNGKYIIWHISISISIRLQRTEAAKRILKADVNNCKCDNMGNVIKTQSITPKLRAGQYFFISYQFLFKNFTTLAQITEMKKNFSLAEKLKC